MRVKKISAFFMAVMLVLSPFTLFSFAADGLKDSGSTQVSMMAMRSIAANEGISMAAAEGNSGTYGYNFEPSSAKLSPAYGALNNATYFNLGYLAWLDAGTYSFNLKFNADFFRVRVINNQAQSIITNETVSGNAHSGVFTLTEPTQVYIYGTFYRSDYVMEDTLLLDYSLYELYPVEGIRSGYTFSSGILNKSTRSIFDTISAYFGNHPAGKYLINIYHWGDSYNVTYQISDPTESYYLPCTTSGSVTTLVYNHPGGSFTLKGSFTASNDETSAVDGRIYGSGASSNWVGGEIVANGSLSWVFNIKDIVAIPYEQAADSNFGLFAPIIGYFNDHFASMKSWIAAQIDKIAGDDETKATVDSAASELQQEVNDLNSLHGQLDSQASTLEQQFSNDFAVPSEVSGQTANLQLMYSGIFSSLGVFSIFIWLPVVLAVIKKLLRL